MPPKYAEIAEALRAEILSGKWPPDSKLPSEAQLMDRFDAAQGTVRRALAILQAEGLTEARQGAGVFVRTFRPILRDAVRRLSAQQWGQGKAIWTADIGSRHLDVDQVQVFRPTEEPPGHVVAILGTADVWVRRRRYSIEERRVMLATSYLPAEIVDGSPITQGDSGEGGTYARLLELGFRPERFIEDIVGRMPTKDEVASLELPSGSPVLAITRTAFTESGREVEVNDMVLDARSYVLRYSFKS